ncbi:lanthionine synthetase C family protein [Kribbella albertanoniae]|uniref:Lanthionine synthetase n=1 Tax=Kribbella albertanoniae TaxID=1266829 RepID=A0A4V2XSZ7_9ACTN|nr:lanthionine synthetase C family protein [Kribbella albertanoniae]TDC35765.1 lanthionine synthetase [Kribbella albertanoniae]
MRTALADAATVIADQLTQPRQFAPGERWRAQSLAKDAAGIALLHIERAHQGHGDWATAHTWLKAATAADISAADDAGLYFGAPAVAFALHTASGTGRYSKALAGLDTYVTALTHRRLDRAEARMTRAEVPSLGEFDLIYGLTGIGAYLLRRAPGGDALQRTLSYLVRLTEPIDVDGTMLPGWWTFHDPSFKESAAFPGGHGNLGLAHGIAGPLALLSLALRAGIVVNGQVDAIERICAWLDTWRQHDREGSWWPQWVSRDEHQTQRTTQEGPLRPSWCYGTPGLARAQQLAAIATDDPARKQMAEQALIACLADQTQVDRIIDTSLCHGWAGLLQTAWRTAIDSGNPAFDTLLQHLAAQLIARGLPGHGDGQGFLEGDAGLALALHTASGRPTASGWDSCLLIN